MQPKKIIIPDAIQELIDQQNPEMAKLMEECVIRYFRQRHQYIDIITSNEANKFTLEQLNAMEGDVLEGIAILASSAPVPDVPMFEGKPRFGGLRNGTNGHT